MVVASPATMEEGRILLVGNETDILHSAFSFPLSDKGKRYPSADHYAHSQILTQLGLDEVHILALLSTSSINVSKKAKELLRENMPSGHDMNSLSQYLAVSRQSYTMMGLRLRAEQDKRFRQTLMETGDALLIVCDSRDTELGIGMDDDEFVQFSRRRHANAERISAWMHDERQRPKEIGQNQLGFFLMWLRYELREKEKAKWLSTMELKEEGISTDQQDKSLPISVSNFVLSLQGPFQPLSNYYAFTYEMKGCFYRSVEHYAYQRLFEALHLPEDEIMKIRTTVKPVDVAKMAKRLFKNLNIDATEVEHKSARLDRWRQSAMKYKITKNDYLQKLLLSTGHALLLETTAEADSQWSCGTDEFEFQHLLSKKYITPQQLIQWQCGRAKAPQSLSHLGGNKTGLLLMELRAKLSAQTSHRMPLIAPLTSSVLRSSISNHLICFSPESVLHPFYPVDIKDTESSVVFPSASHLVAQEAIEFLNISEGNADWIMEPKDAPECWERLHNVICDQMLLPLEKIQQWYQDERQNAMKRALQLQFEQNHALLRVLLDTQDALLVSCSRFFSVEAELHVGIRERDLRLWLSQVQQDSKQLMDICLRPMAFRPPFLGGNRLGFLLMELRREFILAGVFPQQLPEMAQNVDGLLGSESPMENYAATSPFSVLDEINFTAIWANPYLLMLKQQIEAEKEDGARSENEELLTEQWEKAAMSRKQAPLLISRDDPQIDAFFERLLSNTHGESDLKFPVENGTKTNGLHHSELVDPAVEIDEMPPEILRTVYIKMAAQFRLKLAEMDEIQQQINIRSRDSNRLQELLRALERNREHITAVAEKEAVAAATANLVSAPPLPLLPSASQTSTISIVSQPPPLPSMAPTTSHATSSFEISQQLQMGAIVQQGSAQWTQAAALSTGNGRRNSPPPPPFMSGEGMAPTNGGGAFHPTGFTRIPSLLPELLSSHVQQPPPLPIPPQFQPTMSRGGPPLPPQLSTTQPVYSNVRREHPPPAQFSDGGGRRSSRWERSGRRGGPLRRGHQFGAASRAEHSASPPSFSGRRKSRTPPTGSRRFNKLPQRAEQQSASRHMAGDSGSTQGRQQQQTPPSLSTTPTAPPPEKRPKRVVDESELSEGEILSEED